MKLVGELKDKVEKAVNQKIAKEIIKEAGMELTDEEMDQVAGGQRERRPHQRKVQDPSIKNG